MCAFDAEMSFRHCAHVVNWYSLELVTDLLKQNPVPFESQVHAIAYVNSNCNPRSGRADIMKQLMQLHASGTSDALPVHALGGCDRNMPWPEGNPTKRQVISRHVRGTHLY